MAVVDRAGIGVATVDTVLRLAAVSATGGIDRHHTCRRRRLDDLAIFQTTSKGCRIVVPIIKRGKE